MRRAVGSSVSPHPRRHARSEHNRRIQILSRCFGQAVVKSGAGLACATAHALAASNMSGTRAGNRVAALSRPPLLYSVIGFRKGRGFRVLGFVITFLHGLRHASTARHNPSFKARPNGKTPGPRDSRGYHAAARAWRLAVGPALTRTLDRTKRLPA